MAGRQNQTFGGRQSPGKKEKLMNPLNEKGQPLLCISCGSYRHILNSCQDSWENSSKKRNEKSYYTENTESDKEEQAFFIKDFKVSYKKMCQDDNSVEDIVLYTGGNKTKINFLGSETLGSIILDCGCSQNICGEYWLKSYVASLSKEDKRKIEEITDKMKTIFPVWRR